MEENTNINEIGNSKCDGVQKSISDFKNRVQRYCPRFKDIQFELECEWENCEQVHKNMDEFMLHIDYHLSTVENSDCKWRMCDSEGIASVDDLKRHVKFHAFHAKIKQIGVSVLKSFQEREKSLKAPECTVDEHKRNSIPDLPLNFQCAWKKCDYSTDNIELFYRHIRNVHINDHTDEKFPIKCPWNDCDLKINSRFRLSDHIRSHSVEKLAACPNCGTLFSTFSKFIDHCNRSCRIKDNDLRYQCTICSKIFATNTLLKDHMRKHINKFKCPICEMRCIDKYDLNKHILYKHSKEKPFKCELCEYSCKTIQDLKKHFSIIHTERDNFSCTQCEFKTKDLNYLRRHFVKFHLCPNSTADSNKMENNSLQQFSSSYMCHVCNKIYSMGATLTRHLKVQHNIQWQSGYGRFRYKLDSDGYYRLQTVRYDSIELVEKLNRQKQLQVENETANGVILSINNTKETAKDKILNTAALGQLINVIEEEFAIDSDAAVAEANIDKVIIDQEQSTSSSQNLNTKAYIPNESIDFDNIFNSSLNYVSFNKPNSNMNSSFDGIQF